MSKDTKVAIDGRKLPSGRCKTCGLVVAIQSEGPPPTGWCAGCRNIVDIVDRDRPDPIRGGARP